MTKLVAYYDCWQARLRDREEGQALVEYALILALIAVFAIGALELLGGNVSTILNSIASALGGVAGS
jgi:pilus assembly protein Flp/PilA